LQPLRLALPESCKGTHLLGRELLLRLGSVGIGGESRTSGLGVGAVIMV
jgi:hypothetical protein